MGVISSAKQVSLGLPFPKPCQNTYPQESIAVNKNFLSVLGFSDIEGYTGAQLQDFRVRSAREDTATVVP